ncbi:amino acid/amide ABC transporter substrate-binding protein (HAAT family) [Paractinoplanes brasiliensis]|uniref:Amino acid/amide ABC transporter substrate-binding protein (HAAT family) n=2 Tax=Paractinoplanes brasiliensis TaxID=52695 RepID=A0A4R6JSM9_9ACTN|nr:ABC transporter substrate-binding protein [Actinoplanes brasiliensis]TDO38762.1 amino acid/amide ABC transporter substrate-binding protein (HAAT family) [Actinoplanes brasiliensis]GID26460.1 branched-chain amino acid ABC transporter [Actinoplanes brasiliensis]
MRHPRITAATAVASMLLAGAAGCTSDDDAPSGAEVVVIAADLNNSSVDTAYARALQLRVDQINASGRLGNRELRLVTKDNRNDPASSLRNITSFADDPAVAAVVTGSCDQCVVQAAKTINDKAVPTIALAASDEVSSPVADRQYVFKLGPNAADSTAALVAELVRARTRSISVLYTADLYGKGANTALNDALRNLNINVKAARAVNPGASDIAQSVGTLTDAEPDALIVLAPPELSLLAAQDARNAGFGKKIYFDAAAAGDLFIAQEAAAATNNATMVFTQILAIDDVIATTPAKSSRKQWFRDYTSRYGSYSGVASFAADAADLIAEAVARVGTDRPRIREIIETSQVDGLSGPIRMTPDNHSGLMPQALTLLVARSGRWRLSS